MVLWYDGMMVALCHHHFVIIHIPSQQWYDGAYGSNRIPYIIVGYLIYFTVCSLWVRICLGIFYKERTFFLFGIPEFHPFGGWGEGYYSTTLPCSLNR